MTGRDTGLERLAQLAALRRDVEMGRLKRAADACAETRARLDALAGADKAEADPALFHARQQHRRWAVEQRSSLNRTLALQRAEWLQRRDAAVVAFGRAQVTERLRQQKKPSYS